MIIIDSISIQYFSIHDYFYILREDQGILSSSFLFEFPLDHL